MKWTDEYAIGIPELDNQHKMLIELLTDFEKVYEGKAHWNTAHPLILRARGVIRFHFSVEKSLMQIVNYPGFLAHRAEHQVVLQQLEALEHRVLLMEMKDDVLPKLTTWLFQHMIDSDKPFARYAISNCGEFGCAGAADTH